MTPPARNGPAGAVTPGDPVLRPYPVVAKEATESRLREVERLVAGATTMDGIRGPHWGRRGGVAAPFGANSLPIHMLAHQVPIPPPASTAGPAAQVRTPGS